MNIPDFERGVEDANGGRLLPVVTVDHDNGEVLMLAWMNHDAWQATLAEGRAVYYSRSRRELWRKGDTSGHVQDLVEVRVDCDADAILLKVRQTGAACHEGYRSCFFRRLDGIEDGQESATWSMDGERVKKGDLGSIEGP